MTLPRRIELWTDFHSPTDEGVHISTLGVGGGTLIRPELGEEVVLFDGEGHFCIGHVQAVFDVNDLVLVHTRADPQAWWTDSPDYYAQEGWLRGSHPLRSGG